MTTGTVSAIARYPVKSMRGEQLERARLGFHGIPLDRAFAFVQNGVVSPFPWFTGRECPQLLQCTPAVIAGAAEWPSGPWPRVEVTVPGGSVLPLESPELAGLLASWSGRQVRLHVDYRGSQDVAYVSLISTATVRAIAEAAGVPADHRRFRMNLIVDIGDEPFAELAWVGSQVRVGGTTLAIHEPDRRCQMITLDPETGASSPAVLKQLGRLRPEVCAGVYCSVLVPGEVRLGDSVSPV